MIPTGFQVKFSALVQILGKVNVRGFGLNLIASFVFLVVKTGPVHCKCFSAQEVRDRLNWTWAASCWVRLSGVGLYLWHLLSR